MAGTETKVDVAAIGSLAWTIIQDSAATVQLGDSGAVAVIPRGAAPDDILGPKMRRHISFNCEWVNANGNRTATCLIHVAWEAGGTYHDHGAYIRDALVYATDIDCPVLFTLESTTNFHGPDVDDNGVASLQFHIQVVGGTAYRKSSYDYSGSIRGDGTHVWEQFG